MKRVRFEAFVEVPDDAPIADVEAWLKFELGEVCSLSGENAMARKDLVTTGCSRVYVTEA